MRINNRKIIGWLCNILISLPIMISIFILTSHYILGCNFITIYGSSMNPTISQGALMVTIPVAPEKIEVGNIIVFRPPGNTKIAVAHRVVAANLEGETIYFTTKGDALEDNDNYAITEDNILGRTMFWIPFAGRISSSIRTVPGFIFLVLTPAFILISIQIKSLISMRKSKSNTQLSSNRNENLTGKA